MYVPDLQQLDMECNNIGPEGANAIEAGLERVPNSKVTWIDFEDDEDVDEDTE